MPRPDEYCAGDPYGVGTNIDSEFQQGRIRLTVEMVRSVACPGARILDLGCGEGHITARIADLGSAAVRGLDCSHRAIARARASYPNIEFCVADAHMPPYPQHYFDVVVCNNIWEHVPDPIRLLDAVTNVLRPEGHLLISTPSRFRLDNLMNLVRGRRIKFMAPSHVTEYTVGQLAEQLNFRGYEVVKLAAPRATHGRTLKSFLRTTILRRLAAMALGVARVPAVSLESTVFCLARKRVVTGC